MSFVFLLRFWTSSARGTVSWGSSRIADWLAGLLVRRLVAEFADVSAENLDGLDGHLDAVCAEERRQRAA